MEVPFEAVVGAAMIGPVFPLRPNGKTPAIKNWRNEATTDINKLKAWWAEFPNANIGLITDALLVIDVDKRNGGLDTMEELKVMHEFPDTTIVMTPGGGFHMYYTLKPGEVVRGGTNKLGKGVDVKSFGGFVVAAGSWIDGRQYLYLDDLIPA